MARGTGQPVEGRGAFRVAPEDADIDLRVPQITCHVDAGHGDETDNARILYALGEELRHFFADRRSNPVRATGIVRHVSLNPSPELAPAATCRAAVGRSRSAARLRAARGKRKQNAGPDGVHHPALPRASARCVRYQRSGNFLGAIALDDVADLDVVEVLDGDTALVTLLDFADIILEASK